MDLKAIKAAAAKKNLALTTDGHGNYRMTVANPQRSEVFARFFANDFGTVQFIELFGQDHKHSRSVSHTIKNLIEWDNY